MKNIKKLQSKISNHWNIERWNWKKKQITIKKWGSNLV
jgi:hypothetical protein